MRRGDCERGDVSPGLLVVANNKTHLHMRKARMAGSKPPWMRLMQYSILVLPGPQSAWAMLNSSWYCCALVL
jgi:hypothetical protein